MALMDQQSDIRQQMNMHRMVTTDPDKMSSDGERRVETLDMSGIFNNIQLRVHLFLTGTELYWDDPKKVGSKVTTSDGSYYYRGPGYGTSTFLSHSRLKSRSFIKGDDAYFLLSLEGAEPVTL